MTDQSKQKEAVNFLLDNNILISPDVVARVAENTEQTRSLVTQKIPSEDFLFLNKDIGELLLSKQKIDTNWFDFEKYCALAEKEKNYDIYEKFLELLREDTGEVKGGPLVEVVFSYEETPQKIEIQDFVALFNERYNSLEKLLVNRLELSNLMSINRVASKRERESVSFIGMVSDKQYTKNQNIVLVLDDPTGQIRVLVNKTKPELYSIARDIVLDEVIGVSGFNSENIVFANSIVWPDVPKDRLLKKAADETYAVFLSDLHVGSNNFLEEEFRKFLNWINGDAGTEQQRAIAEKVKYIFIVGDLVDGVGIYPGQQKELVISDIYEQYKACAELLRMIPTNIPLIICPGNHDAMRISEPQLPLYKDFAAPVWQLPNAIMVSNPSIINIHRSGSFRGFDVLMYHGYSFDYYVANVDSIRNKGGYDKPDLIMKFLLQKRHLAPTHTSTLYMPDSHKDNLVINQIPDFFVTGHIHKSSVSNYRNVTMICGSCWQSTTSFQEKMGHHPEPCRVPIVNLKTRNVKILKFGD